MHLLGAEFESDEYIWSKKNTNVKGQNEKKVEIKHMKLKHKKQVFLEKKLESITKV